MFVAFRRYLIQVTVTSGSLRQWLFKLFPTWKLNSLPASRARTVPPIVPFCGSWVGSQDLSKCIELHVMEAECYHDQKRAAPC